jgi:hypothetical protein
MCAVVSPIPEFPFRIYALFALIHQANEFADCNGFVEYNAADFLSTFQLGLWPIACPRAVTMPIIALSYRRAPEPSRLLSLPDLSTVPGSRSPLPAPFFECGPARDVMSRIAWPHQ